MPQITRTERVNAFLFLVIGVFLVASVIFVLVGWPLAQKKRTYYLRFRDSITGIDKGTPVRYKGVVIGQIDDIRIDPARPEEILVTLALENDAPITVSTSARIGAASLLGPYNIELEGSRSTSPRLPEGSDIPAAASLLTDLVRTGKTAGDRIVTVLANLEQWTGRENRVRFESVLDELIAGIRVIRESSVRLTPELERGIVAYTELGTTLRTSIEELEPRILRTVDEAEVIAKRLSQFLEEGRLDGLETEVRGTVATMGRELSATAAAARQWMEANRLDTHVERALGDLDRITAAVETTLGSLENESVTALRSELVPTLQGLRRATTSLQELTALLARQPDILLFGEAAPERPLPRKADR